MANKNTITTEFLGLNLASPIVLLSGCVGFGDEYTRLEGFSNGDIGGAVLKGTTLEPRLGNAPHRVYAMLQIRSNHPLARTRVRPHMRILTSRPTSALFSHLHRLNVSSWSLAKVKCG